MHFGLGQRVQQTPVDSVLSTELVASVDRHPLFRFLQIKHLYFANVRSASKFVKVAIMHHDESRSTCAIIQLRQH